MHGSPVPVSVPALILSLDAAAMVIMAVLLRNSLKKTLYSYTNVVLVGAELFAAVLAVQQIYILIAGFPGGSVLETLIAFPRRFSYFAVGPIMLVSLAVCVSNVSLIRHEGACLSNVLGLLLGAFYIGCTVALYFLGEHMSTRFSGNDVLRLIDTSFSMFLLAMLCYFECVFAGACVMGYITATHVPAYDKDYIVILGCSIDPRGGLLPLLKGRVNRAIRFAWEQEVATGKPCLYVPSGGQGPNEVMSEGSAMELYLLSRGAEDYEVFPEKKSTNTYENLLFSKRIIDSLKPGAKIAFATTNYHIFRSGLLAREAGFDAEGIAGDTKWYFWPNGFVREFFAILVMKKKRHLAVAVVLALLCAAVCTAAALISF